MDKPVTTTYAEAQELGELAKRKGLVLYAFQNRRWDSDYLTLLKLVEQKSMGHITDFESQCVVATPFYNIPINLMLYTVWTGTETFSREVGKRL